MPCNETGTKSCPDAAFPEHVSTRDEASAHTCSPPAVNATSPAGDDIWLLPQQVMACVPSATAHAKSQPTETALELDSTLGIAATGYHVFPQHDKAPVRDRAHAFQLPALMKT